MLECHRVVAYLTRGGGGCFVRGEFRNIYIYDSSVETLEARQDYDYYINDSDLGDILYNFSIFVVWNLLNVNLLHID